MRPAEGQTTPRLRFDGEVVAVCGALVTHVRGQDNSLRWDIGDLAEFRAALPALERRRVRELADALERADVRAVLEDASGPVLTLGGDTSLLSRVLFGTRHVRLHQPLAWLRSLNWLRR